MTVHAGDLAALRRDVRDGCVGADLRAERARRRRDGLRDAAHPAAREAPRADAPVAEVADVVVGDDVRRARGAGTGPGADHRGDRQHPAHRVGLEGVLDQVRGAAREQPGEVDGLALVDVLEPAQQQRLAREVGRLARPELRRDLADERTEHLAQAVHPLVPVPDRVGILGGELRDLLAPRGLVVGELEVLPVDARREVGALRVDVVAVAHEVEVAHQRGRQPGDDVGQARDREVGSEGLLADSSATHDVAPLEHEGRQARAGEVGGRDEAVVPAAHDDDVVALGHARTSAGY